MADDLKAIKEKIAKLLAKADNTATTVEEAQAFNAKAYELMERYNLERSQVDERPEDIKRTHRELQVLKRPWSSMVLNGLTHLYFCKWVFTRISDRMDKITIVGEESNVAMCHAIAVMVLRAVQTEARVTGGGRSFMTGAGNVIAQRCYDMRPVNRIAQGTSVGTGNALMVLNDSELRANAEYVMQLFGGKIRAAKPSRARISSSDGFSRGAAFGASVNLKANLLR